MGWLILILVLLAAAFGVLGAVIKAMAFLVLTILLTVAVLAIVAWYGVKTQLRRWQHQPVGPGASHTWTWSRSSERGHVERRLPDRDDRY